jgi:hypothetical protein
MLWRRARHARIPRLAASVLSSAAVPPDMPFAAAPAEAEEHTGGPRGSKRKFLPPFVLPSRLERGVDILHDPVFNKARAQPPPRCLFTARSLARAAAALPPVSGRREGSGVARLTVRRVRRALASLTTSGIGSACAASVNPKSFPFSSSECIIRLSSIPQFTVFACIN